MNCSMFNIALAYAVENALKYQVDKVDQHERHAHEKKAAGKEEASRQPKEDYSCSR